MRQKNPFCFVITALVLATTVRSHPEVIKVGGIFSSEDDVLKGAFQYMVDRINSNSTVLPNSKLSVRVQELEIGKSLENYQKLCILFEEGVVAVFGPGPSDDSFLVSSACSVFHVPHFQNFWYHDKDTLDFTVSLAPVPKTLIQVYKDFVVFQDWLFFVFIYDSDEGLSRLNELQRSPDLMDRTIIEFGLMDEDTGALNSEAAWKKLKDSGIRNVIIDVTVYDIAKLLKEATEFGLTSEYYAYFISSLGFDSEELKDTTSTYFSIHLVNEDNADLQAFEKYAKSQHIGDASDKLAKTSAAFMLDSVKLLAYALHNHFKFDSLKPSSLSCANKTVWDDGGRLFSALMRTRIEGATQKIAFNKLGYRDLRNLEIREVRKGRTKMVAFWDYAKGVRIESKDDVSDSEEDMIEEEVSLENKTLIVATVLSVPFVMESGEDEEGRKRYEGYCIDLLEKLSDSLGFDYVIQEVSTFGKQNDSGEWTGIMGEITKGRADLAVAPLTVTSSRSEVVDFTAPFMDAGVGLVYTYEEETVVHSFLSPFSTALWFYVFFSFVMSVSILCIVGRLSPFGWKKVDSSILETQFTIGNSTWTLFSCFMFQRFELNPRSASTFVAFSTWWVFTLIVVVSYGSVLGDFIIRYSEKPTLETVEDLLNHNEIQYGTLADGATQSFFQKSAYPQYMELWQGMVSMGPEVFVDSYDEGFQQVKDGHYAFFVDSPRLEYELSRECSIQQIGDLIGHSSYAIALPKGSSYHSLLSAEILKLRRTGSLLLLREFWWKTNYVCPREETVYRPTPFTVRFGRLHLLFVFLLIGFLASLILTCFSFVQRHGHRMLQMDSSADSSGTLWETLVQEIRSTLLCKPPTKQQNEEIPMPPLASHRDVIT